MDTNNNSLIPFGDLLNKISQNPALSFLVTRNFKRKIMKNAIVDKAIAEYEAKKEIDHEIAKREKPDAFAEFLNNYNQNEESFPLRSLKNVVEHSMWQQMNRDYIAIEAYKELNDSNNYDAKVPPSEDFMASFFDHASNISKEDVQKLWGKILAQEIINPGSFSLYTLNVLKRMERYDIENFSIVAEFLFGNVLLCPYANIPTFGGFEPEYRKKEPRSIWNAFEVTGALGLTQGPNEGKYISVDSMYLKNITIRHGTISLKIPKKYQLLIFATEPHHSFFELIPVLNLYHPHLYGTSMIMSDLYSLGIQFRIKINKPTDSMLFLGNYSGACKIVDNKGIEVQPDKSKLKNSEIMKKYIQVI